MLKKKTTIDLVHDPIVPSIIKYATPIILASLIQTLFNAADLAVLGRFDTSPDSSAVGAVGATGSIIGLIVSSVIGLSGGTNVLLARAVGAGDLERSRRIVGTSILLSLVVGVVVGLLGVFSSGWFLRATDCPANCFEGARTYLYIYFAASPAIFIYNFGSAIIRVSGDSTRPLYYMVIAGALNVVANLALCVLMENKVAAVAIATLASQVLGAILVVLHLARIDGPCKADFRHPDFSFRELGIILRVGFPSALNGALYSISNLQIQSAINGFGSSAAAGNSSSAQFEGFINSFSSAFGVTALTLVGQNVGAGKRDRVKRSILLCSIISCGTTLALGYGLLAFGEGVLGLFLPNDPLAVSFGLVRMTCLLSLYWMQGIASVIGSAIQAFGYPSLTMINSIVTVLLFRFVWMWWIYPYLPVSGDPVRDIFNLFVCYMFSWTLSLIVCAAMFAVTYRRYLRGKVKVL